MPHPAYRPGVVEPVCIWRSAAPTFGRRRDLRAGGRVAPCLYGSCRANVGEHGVSELSVRVVDAALGDVPCCTSASTCSIDRRSSRIRF